MLATMLVCQVVFCAVFPNVCYYVRMLGQVFYIVFLNACHYARMLGRFMYSVP